MEINRTKRRIKQIKRRIESEVHQMKLVGYNQPMGPIIEIQPLKKIRKKTEEQMTKMEMRMVSKVRNGTSEANPSSISVQSTDIVKPLLNKTIPKTEQKSKPVDIEIY